MEVTQHTLFPTRMVSLQFPGVEELNADLFELMTGAGVFRDGFDMHPDSLNLLTLADTVPAIARVRQMFLDGLSQYLKAEGTRGELTVDMVLFSNLADRGDYTLVHNHSADVVGVYYVRTAAAARPAVAIPDPDGDYDYFEQEDGALLLHDPRFNANRATGRGRDYVKVFPRPGLMVIFPAYVWHSVTAHQGDTRRLALSANFTLRVGASNAVALSLQVE